MLRDRGCVHGAATRTLADAAQASQIARSVSFLDLFRNAIHYEGSPGLWHVLLWVMVRLHVSYVGMHWLSALITLCGVFLAVPFAPFPLPLRLLLPFTYFMAYQYSTIARYRERRLRYLIPIAMLARFWMITRFDFYHAGLVWLLALFIWWITWPKDTSDTRHRILVAFFALFLITQIMWAARAVRYDATHAYSPDLAATPYLQHYLDEAS